MQTHVLEYLEASAAAFPTRTAFADERESVCFEALMARARAVGSALLPHVSSGKRPVAVLTGRSVWAVIGFLGALYAGCPYVSIDREMPAERMEKLLGQVSPAAILYAPEDRALADSLAAFAPALSLRQAAGGSVDEAGLAARRADHIDLDPAYVLFTSGSTGTPKGILISHRALIDFTDWYAAFTGADETDVLGNQAPFFFDLSVKDVYLALATGACCVILPRQGFSFPLLLMEQLNQRRVTTLSWSASAFHLIAESGALEKDPPRFLKRVLVGGEALRARPLNRWRAACPKADYVNLYGPTEVTVDCTYYPIRREFADDEAIPIGRACPNKRVLLLDEQLRPVAPGEPGEICVAGTGLALGYLGDPEKTAAAFVPDPADPAQRLYRTGDMARLGEDGELYFLARKDGQVKHMGYRVELGEIETALAALPQIAEAACLFDTTEDKLVCVYAGQIEEKPLAKLLRERLPRYMVPNRYHRLQALPHTPNGKLDRAGLRREYA